MTILTRRLYADPAAPDGQDLREAAGILRAGGTVAFATETVYGLGANALDPDAVASIFLAKQRPGWDPLIVHIADIAMLPRIVSVVSTIAAPARLLIDAFWPGPLTLLLPRHPDLPGAVTAGRAAVGVRMPAHPVARALIRAAGLPIAAPSANTFGHVSPTTAAHVAADLDGRIDAILDSGATLHGLESTVLDATVDPCVLYRPGAITLEQLRCVSPRIEPYREQTPAPEGGQVTGQGPAAEQGPTALPSPGLGLRHYAPRGRLVLIEGPQEALAPRITRALAHARAAGQRAGLLLPQGLNLEADDATLAGANALYDWGAWNNPAQLAQRLFAGLRTLDDAGVAVIVCPVPEPAGIGIAIIDRLRKAARRV